MRVGLVAVAVLIGAGCATNRRGFTGITLIRETSSQDDAAPRLFQTLVSAYHADPEDADCLVREALRDKWGNADPSTEMFLDWSKEDFEEYADTCDMDFDDLWSTID
jgi:hypothetical protein